MVIDGVGYMIIDKPHCSDPGRQQEENLYKETAFHVCLRSAHDRIHAHSAAAGHHHRSLCDGAS